jgi:CHAT domain-containing protein
LQSISGQLAALAYRTPDPKQIAGWKSLVRDLTERKESIEQKLAAKNSDFRSQRASLEVEPDQVRAVLADDVALIDCLEYTHYVRSSEKGKMKRERRLAAFVVQHGRPTRFVDLAPVEVIRKNVEAWRSSFGDSAEAVTAARELRKTVWQPIEPFLNGVQTVLLSPDGDLARFPLGALPSKNGTGYLIEDVSLVIVPVPRLLPEFAVRREKRPSAPSALFIGDVAFDAETRGVTPDDAGKTLLADATRRPAVRFGSVYFPPLPGSAAEIEQIANMHARQFGAGQQSVLSGNLATEETFRNLAPRSTTLHLATHGFFQPVHERINSARADDPELTSFGDRERVVEFHPGLQCGLALAGANHKTTSKQSLDVRLGDDGILTAVEVASLDLRNVDLVTLSACETGLGKTASGEGVLGLQRAFQIAGARNVVASLWRVDDQGTAALMRLFYRKLWVEKKKPATALREAELAILRDPSQVESQANTRGPRYDAAVKLKATSQKSGSRPTASPRLWAAFILSGDWR